jgi:hypothetical protein
MRSLLRIAAAITSTVALTACGPSIFSLRVPLEEPGAHELVSAGSVSIDDQRPAAERKVHTGAGLFRCERWYGDETYVPSKVEYLRRLLQARTPAGGTLHVRLDRLDTIEYCENTANRAGAAAAAGAGAAAGGGAVYVQKDVPGGDSVLIRAAGEANGKPFEVSRGFDYSTLTVPFPQMPAYNPTYVALLRRAFDEIADEIASQPAR